MSHIPRGLADRQARLLATLAVRPSLTRASYQMLAGIARGTAQNDLQELLAAGLIERIGSSRASRYVLAPPDPARLPPVTGMLPAQQLPVSGPIEHDSTGCPSPTPMEVR